MSIRLIGAGLGRTGTLSLKHALERIGYGPCYHMIEVLGEPERRVPGWLALARGGAPDWDALLDGFEATVDWPAAAFWRELAAHYPAAKVLLSVRDADRWHASMMNTIHPVITRGVPEGAPDWLGSFHAMVHALVMEQAFQGKLADPEHAKRVYEAHNQAVIDAIPAQRLLVYRPGDGWEPLCRFLDVAVPDEEFPHVNDTAEYRARALLPALEESG